VRPMSKDKGCVLGMNPREAVRSIVLLPIYV
jgi:hypothetical protein